MRHSIKQILILLKLEDTLGSQGKTSKKPEKQMIYSISNPNALTKSLFFSKKEDNKKKMLCIVLLWMVQGVHPWTSTTSSITAETCETITSVILVLHYAT